MIEPSSFAIIINNYLPEPHASLLNGIIFGINPATTNFFYNKLKIVGLLHIVVLSGTNISMLSAIILSMTSFLGKQLSILLTILIIFLFVIFVGPQAPIVRAAIMGTLTLVAVIFGRRSYALYSLLISLIIISLFWPRWLSSISLHLSYGATLGLIIFTPFIKSTSSIIDKIKDELNISIAAQIFTAPLIFYHFRQISLISPVSNLLVSFAIGPLMILGLLAAILGKINFYLGIIPAYLCYGLLAYMIFIIDLLSKTPFASFSF